MFLTVKDLKKSYGSTSNKVEVLKGINFEVEKGEICVLLGPSGSGKSTLLNIIGGIDDADLGYVSIDSEKTKDMKEKSLQDTEESTLVMYSRCIILYLTLMLRRISRLVLILAIHRLILTNCLIH